MNSNIILQKIFLELSIPKDLIKNEYFFIKEKKILKENKENNFSSKLNSDFLNPSENKFHKTKNWSKNFLLC